MKGGEGACLFGFNGGGGEREAVMCALLSSLGWVFASLLHHNVDHNFKFGLLMKKLSNNRLVRKC
jgi:accessory gene regulator protein AgrB